MRILFRIKLGQQNQSKKYKLLQIIVQIKIEYFIKRAIKICQIQKMEVKELCSYIFLVSYTYNV